MIRVLIIDKDKNLVEVDLLDENYKFIFRDKIETSNIKRHKTTELLVKEIRKFFNSFKEK